MRVRRKTKNSEFHDTPFKKCWKCDEVKLRSEFWRSSSYEDGLYYHCAMCMLKDKKRDFQERMKDPKFVEEKENKRKKVHQRNREHIAAYVQGKCCVDCGFDNPDAFHFDHVRGEKKGLVSLLVSRCASLQRIDEELAKCEIRCANCHAIKTKQEIREKRQNGYYKRVRLQKGEQREPWY